ncbi:MAG: DUF1178 family protein [Alphaproteobacteria bacterium]|nr:DUF1178 family protein [Alphaproteobacteria bacterium]
MIHFSLRCSHEHVFDDWFTNSAEFETKLAEGSLKCPHCGDTAVTKGIMAPNVGGASSRAASEPQAPSCGMGGCGGGMCGMGF